MKAKKHRIKLLPFPLELHFWFTDGLSEKQHCDGLTSAVPHKNLITVELDSEYCNPSVIAHEAVHAIFRIEDAIEEKISEETFAYFEGHIVEEMTKKWLETKK